MKTKAKFLLILLLFSSNLFAQRPSEIQLSDEPVVWSEPWSIALYIVMPIVLIIAGIYLRNRAKNKKS
jgi:hypothetical protein